MENKNNDQKSNFKSYIVLPFISVIALIVSICFAFVKDFTKDLSPMIVWIFFVVGVAYVAVAILDTFIGNETSKKKINFVRIFSIITTLIMILYIVLYLIFK